MEVIDIKQEWISLCLMDDVDERVRIEVHLELDWYVLTGEIDIMELEVDEAVDDLQEVLYEYDEQEELDIVKLFVFNNIMETEKINLI